MNRMTKEKMARKFTLGEVLSVVTGIPLSDNWGDEEGYGILGFMTGDRDLQEFRGSVHQLAEAEDRCRPYLIKEFPQLATPAIDLAIEDLRETLKGLGDEEAQMDKALTDWLKKQAAKYGNVFVVRPIPKGARADHREVISRS